jgi:hypothetical protein
VTSVEMTSQRRILAREFVLAIAAAASVSGAVMANDSSTGVASPIFATQSAHHDFVRNASVRIDGSAVTVALDVDIRPGEPGRASVTMPKFSWRGAADPYPDRQYPELKIDVDGKPAVLDDGFEAFVGSLDVSKQVRDAKLDPFAITDSPPIVEPARDKGPEFKALEDIGAITQNDDLHLAHWSARRIVQLQLPNGSSRVTLRYNSRPAYHLTSLSELGARDTLSSYCLTPTSLRRGLAGQKRDSMWVAEEHSISVNGVGTAHLEVTVGFEVHPNAQAVAFFCSADGKSLSTHKTQTETSRANADGEFRLMIVRPAR